MKANEMKALTLAYLGDAYYELIIRKYIISTGIVKPHELQRASVKLVSAKAQALIVKKLMDNSYLSTMEETQVKRGRNSKSRSPRNTDPVTYKMSTGFEALIGYLYMDGQHDRLDELMKIIIEFHERGELNG
jgi:ribonuclease-3 family protein